MSVISPSYRHSWGAALVLGLGGLLSVGTGCQHMPEPAKEAAAPAVQPVIEARATDLLKAADCLFIPIYYIYPDIGGQFTLIAFVITILGGLGSTVGAIIGGLFLVGGLVLALVAAVAIVSSFSIFGKLGSAFMPQADPGQFQVSFKANRREYFTAESDELEVRDHVLVEADRGEDEGCVLRQSDDDGLGDVLHQPAPSERARLVIARPPAPSPSARRRPRPAWPRSPPH